MRAVRVAIVLLAGSLVVGGSVACTKEEVLSDEQAAENAAESFNKGVEEAAEGGRKAVGETPE